MPLPTSLLGSSTDPATFAVDVRATMAYAAGIGDANEAYLDTTRPGGVVAHPLFPVSPEWPVVLAAGRLAPHALTRAETKVGLHLTNDLVIHRLVRPGDVLATTATVETVAQHRSGAFEVLRLESVDQHGAPVATTRFGMLLRGVAIEPDAGDPDPHPPAAEVPLHEVTTAVTRDLSPVAAHVYTECSRIWNPIHTDPVAAHAAGLPEIVLHGTATLAMAVSAVVDHRAGGDPTRVRRIRARFGALVTLPSTIEIQIGAAGADGAVPFAVRNAAGDRAVRDGEILLDPSA